MATFAQRYSHASTHQAEDGLKLIDQLSLSKNSKVLDLGCGTGYLSSVLAERVGPGGKVIGVDPDKERIRLAREKYEGAKNLVFVEGSAEEFPEGPYDLVFSNYVIHWIDNKEPVFKNVYQNLASGGCLAFTALERRASFFYELDPLVGRKPPIFYLPCEDYKRIVSNCGFATEFVSVNPKRKKFPSVDALLEWLSASTGSQEFDHKLYDSSTVASIKRLFRDGTVELEFPLVTFILNKP